MNSLKRLLLPAVALTLAVPIVDYVLVTAKERRVCDLVVEYGGQMRSIGGWPIGKEFAIRLERPLTAAELDQLSELNTLRGSVAVVFYCEITAQQIDLARQRLPQCDVYRVDDQGMRKL